MIHLDDERLDAYLDGTLTDEQVTATEAHLAVCAACRRELAALRELVATFPAVPTAPLTVDLTPRVLRRVGPEAQRRRRWLVAGLLLAQATLTALLVSWLILPRIGGPLPIPAWLGLDGATQGVRAWLTPGLPPATLLAPAHWGLLVAGIALLWLCANRLILARRDEEAG